MTQVYLLYILGGVISILLYKKNITAAKVGFSIAAVASLYGIIHFFSNLGVTSEMTLGNDFLFNPHFVLDPVGNFFSFVICLISFAASIYAIQYSQEYAKKGSLAVMAMLFNVFIVSMLLVISAANVFWFMVFWEVMTIVSYFLICFNDSKESMKATIIYMGIAHLGGAMILAAFLLLASQSGSLDFASFANVELSAGMATAIFLLAFIGFGSKAGMFPMHVWLPKAHPAAPSNVSALMSGVMIKVAIFGIIKFCLWLPVMEWWGLLIITVGAISALLGVLYALTQHDYKALLAYHSVENIGIILLGIGTGVYGMASGSPVLAAVGFLGGMFHILNHATFKGLLFLGAGSVLYSTHTKDMEVLGGLARKMPYTAFAFLVGSMAITALPPLNGFMSEWVTYQALIQGALGEGIGPRTVFTVSVVALALTGALAVMCFVKVYAVIFGGTARDEKIFDNAREVPFSMLAGMFILVIGCFAFGLGANVVVEHIMSVVTGFTGGTFIATDGMAVKSPLGSIVSTPFISLILLGSLIMPFITLIVFKANRKAPRKVDPWACGMKYSSRMQMTAAPFTGDLRRMMNWLFKADVHYEDQGYFKPVKYSNHARDIWWDYLYVPVIKLVSVSSDKIEKMQNGNSNLYAAYILGALFFFLGISHIS
ncbi:MAG: hydrogenase 4 subunit B [Sulfurovum sp.]|nr:MAG: hydrogenase 4 subunit B [Sulfurovum sp.]